MVIILLIYLPASPRPPQKKHLSDYNNQIYHIFLLLTCE